MIPFQGFIADVLAIIALIRFWRHPLPLIWWITLGLFVFALISTSVLKESVRVNPPRHPTTTAIGIICTILQLVLIGVGIYSFFR